MGVVWLTYTNVITSVPPPELIMVIDNSGVQVTSGGENVFITTPVQVIDNSGSDVVDVVL